MPGIMQSCFPSIGRSSISLPSIGRVANLPGISFPSMAVAVFPGVGTLNFPRSCTVFSCLRNGAYDINLWWWFNPHAEFGKEVPVEGVSLVGYCSFYQSFVIISPKP